MGGSVGHALDPTGGSFLGLNKIPKVGPFLGRVGGDIATGGLAEFGRRDPFTGLLTNPENGIMSPFGPGGSGQSSGIGGPFSLDPNQLAADTGAINNLGTSQGAAATALGQKQYDQNQGFIGQDAASRTAAEALLGKNLSDQFKNNFAYTLPNIAESSQAAHLYDSTGYGQEVARQQAQGLQNITSQVGQQGISDIYNTQAQKSAALAALQGTQTGGLGITQGAQQSALGRQFSLEDFINQANVAKTIGAQMAPQPPTGKQNFGTVAQGIGALAPIAGLAMGGPAGTSGKGGGGH